MAGSIAASAFFPAPKSGLHERPDSLEVCGIAAKPASSSSAVRVGRTRAHAAVPKVNGAKSALADGEHEAVSSAAAPRTFYNQLPDWSMPLAAITIIFLAAEKQWTLIDWKPKRPDMLVYTFGFGRIIQDKTSPKAYMGITKIRMPTNQRQKATPTKFMSII
jgi:fatty acyl-ACP thioesterase B